MAVSTVIAAQPVLVAQGSANPYGNRLLPVIRVDRSPNAPLETQAQRLFVEAANQDHGAEHLDLCRGSWRCLGNGRDCLRHRDISLGIMAEQRMFGATARTNTA